MMNGEMVSEMTSAGSQSRAAGRILIPEVLFTIQQDVLNGDEWVECQANGPYKASDLRRRVLKAEVSEPHMEFNPNVVDIWEVADRCFAGVRFMERKYGCSRIMATSLVLKQMKACAERAKHLVRRASHPQDEEALQTLIDSLECFASNRYHNDLLPQARRVGAIRSQRYVHQGRVFEIEEPDYELIEARFALETVWDGEAAMALGTTEHNRRQVKKVAPKLHGDPTVVQARQAQGIPPSGFQDLDAAHEWALQWLADPLLSDDTYWQELVWWESFTWDPDSEAVIGRGYIMLHQPAMKETLGYLVREYQLASGRCGVLALYLIRGQLEPPPRTKWRQPPMRKRDERLTDLVDEYGYELAQVIYNGQLAAQEAAKIVERDPKISPAKLYIALCELADERSSWPPRENQVTYDGLRKIVSRMHAIRRASAKHEGM